MAERGRKPGFTMSERPFYVYQFTDEAGDVVYIGKGSGRRLKAQERRFGRSGVVVASFASEGAAYRCEARLIARHKPALNRIAGGGGPISGRRPVRRTKEEVEMARIGTRKYAARVLCRLLGVEAIVGPEKIAMLRAAAA